jgi:hypothetical protein
MDGHIDFVTRESRFGVVRDGGTTTQDERSHFPGQEALDWMELREGAVMNDFRLTRVQIQLRSGFPDQTQ